MSIEPGLRLGPYEVLSPLGAGGMGEVYKAKDTRLDRSVALKVLPSELARDPSRRARLEREAKAISQLDHPHICALYDIGAHDGVDFLVMQYLEGETLADRLKRGALPLEQALELVKQMASALAAAHEHGIVHRDLKPSNVMLTKSGVKLLDFGLAKWEEKAGSVAPTEAKPLTQEGALLGTIPYMAPEQLEGKEADARSDIYAFGAVLYEMVTGRRAYDEEHRRELSPPLLESVVSRALAKAPAERWRSVGDIEILLGLLRVPEASVPKVEPRSRVAHFVWAGLVVLAGLTAWWIRPVPRGKVTRVSVTLPEGERLLEGASPSFAISADGRRLAFVGRASSGTTTKLYVRDLTSFDTRVVAGADGAQQPVFSPDGESVAYLVPPFIQRISWNGGAASRLCETAANVSGLTWTDRGEILFGTFVGGIRNAGGGAGIWRVSENGGTPEPLTRLAPGEAAHTDPNPVAGNRGLLFTIVPSGGVSEIAYLPPDATEHRVLFEGSAAAYVPGGHLVFGRGSSTGLFAVAFDVDSGEVRGPPIPIDDVVLETQYRVGSEGTLVYVPGESVPGSDVVWVDRGGKVEIVARSDHRYHTVDLSPDGKSFAADESEGGYNHIWVHDIERGTKVLAVDGVNLLTPRFGPDGRSIAYSIKDNIFVSSADGTGAALPVVNQQGSQGEPSWSSDGSLLVYTGNNADTADDIWILPLGGSPRPFVVTSAIERAPAFSPNGKWIAYQSDASGRQEIYVQPFPGPGVRGLISTNGGKEPVWSRDGRELFYRENTALMAVSVEVGDSFRAGVPKLLFDGPYVADGTGHASYDVSPDGQRFLMIHNPEGRLTELRVVLNFPEELKALAALER